MCTITQYAKQVSRNHWQPVLLGSLVALIHVAKPAVVDDQAYLMFAEHIQHHPLDPYGFEHFWYKQPEPAMNVLAPPVMIYWLALGKSLVGESLFALKLFLAPFPILLAFGVRSLLRWVAPRSGSVWLPVLMLGPGILPFLNMMLDIPALALALSALAVFTLVIRPSGSWQAVLGAGFLLGLALQTKYSVIGFLPILLWMGWTTGRFKAGLLSVAISVMIFASWEVFLDTQHGESHFLHHLQSDLDGPEEARAEIVDQDPVSKIKLAIARKFANFVSTVSNLGLTAGWLAVTGLLCFAQGRRFIRPLIITQFLVFIYLLVAPASWVCILAQEPGPDRLTLNKVYFYLSGFAAVGSALCLAAHLVRSARRETTRPEASQLAWFLIGACLLEFLATLALTPFPAARRTIGISCFLCLLFARYWELNLHDAAIIRTRVWFSSLAIGIGLTVNAVDIWDAHAEKVVPAQAVTLARQQGLTGTGWYVGHWGYQHYCDRLGLKPLAPGSVVLPGDWIVYPEHPDAAGFYRPELWKLDIDWQSENVTRVGWVEWRDGLSGQTIPHLYGGRIPVVTRKHPRLRVGIYQVQELMIPQRPIEPD